MGSVASNITTQILFTSFTNVYGLVQKILSNDYSTMISKDYYRSSIRALGLYIVVLKQTNTIIFTAHSSLVTNKAVN